MSLSPKFLIAGIVTAVVVCAVIAGLISVGSPAKERTRRADEQRVNDLQSISYAMDVYVNREHEFPSTLEGLRNSRDAYVQNLADPSTGVAYEFRAMGEGAYALCATFETATSPTSPAIPYDRTSGNGFWQHGVGRTCFQLQIQPRPELVPPAPLSD